jgi:hypothetical protein
LRVQITETFETHDVEMVLSALERSLRDVSTDAIRQGRQIMLRGLGPSQRTMNRNDITVIEVSTEGDRTTGTRTTIHADVTYQASALLGGAPQDEIVRSKLDRVFDNVKMQLRTRSVRVTAPPDPPEPLPLFEPGPFPELGPVIEIPVAITAQPEEEDVPPVTEEAAAVPATPEVEPERAEPPTQMERPPTRVEWKPSASSSSIISAYTRQREERPGVRIFETAQPERSKRTRPWGIMAAVTCVLAAVLIFLGWPYLQGLVDKGRYLHSGSVDMQAVQPVPAAAESSASAPEKTVADSGLLATPTDSIHNEADVGVWLQSWVAAMRTRDPAAQATFYADPVDRYFLKSNVSYADVLLDKETAIRNRKELWTMELQDIVIEQKPDSTARVRFVKHFISQTSEAQISEQFVRSQLKLKRIDGQWKITAEQTLQ